MGGGGGGGGGGGQGGVGVARDEEADAGAVGQTAQQRHHLVLRLARHLDAVDLQQPVARFQPARQVQGQWAWSREREKEREKERERVCVAGGGHAHLPSSMAAPRGKMFLM